VPQANGDGGERQTKRVGGSADASVATAFDRGRLNGLMGRCVPITSWTCTSDRRACDPAPPGAGRCRHDPAGEPWHDRRQDPLASGILAGAFGDILIPSFNDPLLFALMSTVVFTRIGVGLLRAVKLDEAAAPTDSEGVDRAPLA
jgi:hypothetical protein